MELTLTCPCGAELPESADSTDSIDGIVSCRCGARYAYSATMLVSPEDVSADESEHLDTPSAERSGLEMDDD